MLAVLTALNPACSDSDNVDGGRLVNNNCYDALDLAYLQEVVDTNGNPQIPNDQLTLTFKTHFSRQDQVQWAQEVLDASTSAPLCHKNQ